jgi:hypothetical protein
VAHSALGSRTKRYLGLGGPSPTDPVPDPPSATRRVVVNGTFLAIGVILALFGSVEIASAVFIVTGMNVAQILYRHWRPTRPTDRRGWYLDPGGSGEWLWWDGATWTERPPAPMND